MPTTSKSQTTTKAPRGTPLVARRLPTHRPPTHPGEMLLEEFLRPLGISQSAFAVRLGVSLPTIALSLFARIDHWHNDAPCPGIEDSFDILACIPWNSNQGCNARGGDHAEHPGNGVDIERAVLGVEGEPIEAQRGDVFNRLWTR